MNVVETTTFELGLG